LIRVISSFFLAFALFISYPDHDYAQEHQHWPYGAFDYVPGIDPPSQAVLPAALSKPAGVHHCPKTNQKNYQTQECLQSAVQSKSLPGPNPIPFSLKEIIMWNKNLSFGERILYSDYSVIKDVNSRP
jgi:hypothetical protein